MLNRMAWKTIESEVRITLIYYRIFTISQFQITHSYKSLFSKYLKMYEIGNL